MEPKPILVIHKFRLTTIFAFKIEFKGRRILHARNFHHFYVANAVKAARNDTWKYCYYIHRAIFTLANLRTHSHSYIYTKRITNTLNHSQMLVIALCFS